MKQGMSLSSDSFSRFWVTVIIVTKLNLDIKRYFSTSMLIEPRYMTERSLRILSQDRSLRAETRIHRKLKFRYVCKLFDVSKK
jgi:hypothetical protein